jgi:hypothetical protein
MSQTIGIPAGTMIDTSARRNTAVSLSVFSILANLEWVTLPFSFYGLVGRSRVLYGQYTLMQTFSFHPTGWLWWTLFGLQAFTVLAAASGVLIGLSRALRLGVFLLPAVGFFVLDVYVAFRWGTPSMWLMYLIGVIPSLLLAGSAACFLRSQ